MPSPNIGWTPTYSRQDWYVRGDADEDWFGPLTRHEADMHARRSTMDGNVTNVKYMQVGTILGDRAGDPIQPIDRMFVTRIYANGKLVLKGRQAEFHKDLLKNS